MRPLGICSSSDRLGDGRKPVERLDPAPSQGADELSKADSEKCSLIRHYSASAKNVSALAKYENYYAIGTFTGFSIYEKKENKLQKIFYDKETAGISGFVFHSLDDFYVSTYGTGIIHYAHLQRAGKINTPTSTITLENIFPYSRK